MITEHRELQAVCRFCGTEGKGHWCYVGGQGYVYECDDFKECHERSLCENAIYKKGFAAGHEAGLAEGEAIGHETGYRAGYEAPHKPVSY